MRFLRFLWFFLTLYGKVSVTVLYIGLKITAKNRKTARRVRREQLGQDRQILTSKIENPGGQSRTGSLHFSRYEGETERTSLPYGDYSLPGVDGKVAVERLDRQLWD